jgi:hypothetical protein
VLSPLLANLYLDPMDHAMVAEGYEMVRYADDCAPRRRRKEEVSLEASCSTGDGGRSSGVGWQEQAPNRLKLQRSKANVVSVSGKGRQSACQVRTKKTNASEPLRTCRKRKDGVKTGWQSLTREESGRNLLAAQAASGMKAA